MTPFLLRNGRAGTALWRWLPPHGTWLVRLFGHKPFLAAPCLFDSPLALILTCPTLPIPFVLEEYALIDGATRLPILRRITLPLAVPGLVGAGIFAFTPSWSEFICALAFTWSSEKRTVAVAVLTQLVQGDDYQWGALMAGALFGSIPVGMTTDGGSRGPGSRPWTPSAHPGARQDTSR